MKLLLDPFCGCGTAISVAQRLGRRWVGIDITHLAITLIKNRLRDAFGQQIGRTYKVVGEPPDLPGARALAEQDRFQFQCWAVGKLGASPLEQRRGADRGIDGRIKFVEDSSGRVKQIIMSVKSGATGPAHVRDLRGVIERENAAVGVFITLSDPTRAMVTEAASAGFYESPYGGQRVPRLQIVTIEDILAGRDFQRPPVRQDRTYREAPRARGRPSHQGQLPLQ